MRKTILTILGSTLLVASVAQAAVAAEHQNGRKAHGATAAASERFRNSNAYLPQASAQPDWSRYQYGAESAPAGR